MVNFKTEVTKKQSTPNFPKNEHFLSPDTQTYVFVSGGKKCSFFGKFCVLCFLVTSILRFALLPYHRRYEKLRKKALATFCFYLYRHEINSFILSFLLIYLLKIPLEKCTSLFISVGS